MTAGVEHIVLVTVRGFVQGVGYRAWTQRNAESRGVRGWVRNRWNGTVEAVFAGSEEPVEALCKACWRGPALARVEAVDVAEPDLEALAELGAMQGFRQIETR
ncbi:acylphosphatase [Methylocapsa acidiphila]|uniref:acylphosphatase n=1 Tax=Methylocapsa acidiphila TaxID=133552 RepID=UPI00047DF867|nr:acylphosphatase [Methylocapsa acidiphila]